MAVFSLGFTHTHTQRNNRENQFNSDRLGGKAEIGSETIGGNPVKRCFAATESVTGSSTKDSVTWHRSLSSRTRMNSVNLSTLRSKSIQR